MSTSREATPAAPPAPGAEVTLLLPWRGPTDSWGDWPKGPVVAVAAHSLKGASGAHRLSALGSDIEAACARNASGLLPALDSEFEVFRNILAPRLSQTHIHGPDAVRAKVHEPASRRSGTDA